MRFLAPLDSDWEAVTTGGADTEEDALPDFVRECAARLGAEEAEQTRAFYTEALGERRGARRHHASKPPVQSVAHSTLRHPSPEPGSLELNNRERCEVLGLDYSGDWFAYLLTQSGSGRTNAAVGYCTNPLLEVCLHNARHASERWQLAMVSGPFVCKEHARDYGYSLVTGTRGDKSKKEKWPYLCSVYNKTQWCLDVAPQEPLLPLLRCYADPLYAELYGQELLPTTTPTTVV